MPVNSPPAFSISKYIAYCWDPHFYPFTYSFFLFSHFRHVQVLDLSNNLLRSVPDNLCSMTSLTQLFLRNNQIGDYDFPKSLAGLTKLRDLNMSGNRLEAIPPQVIKGPY